MENSISVSHIVEEIINIESPEESVLLEHYDPKSLSNGKTLNGPLGFGAEATVVLLLPIVYKFIDIFVDEIMKESAKGLIKKIKCWIFEDRKENIKKIELLKEIQQDLENNGIDQLKAISTAETILQVLINNKEYILSITE